mmetsp:Transcript_9081/g.24257  ORF Transcript_9081/g.24257 Transcript_9081/m.24257 type:complete len:245 (+) Transcript_9081:68-802(+)
MVKVLTIHIHGVEMDCVRVTPCLLCVEKELSHIIWVLLDLRKRGSVYAGGLPHLFASHMLPFLGVSVDEQNLWNAFGIKRNGHPQWGRTVRCSRAIELLTYIPSNQLLGIDWQFPGSDGGYSLLHRACDPALEGLHEGVATSLLHRTDFNSCNARRFGITALHFMAARGWANACRLLIQRPDFTETLSWVRTNIESSNGVFFHAGDTVLDVARSQNHTNVVQAVKETLAMKNAVLMKEHGVQHF